MEPHMENRHLMFALKQLDSEWNALMKRIALNAGIPDPYRFVIAFLSMNPGASQKDLSEASRKTYASISQTVKEMERDGYLLKDTDTNDKRYATLFLSEKGKEASARMKNALDYADSLITETLSPEKEEEMIRTFDVLRTMIQEVN